MCGEEVKYLKVYHLIRKEAGDQQPDIMQVKADAFRIVVGMEQVQNITSNLFWPRGIRVREWQFQPKKLRDPITGDEDENENELPPENEQHTVMPKRTLTSRTGCTIQKDRSSSDSNHDGFTTVTGANRKRHREKGSTISPEDTLNKRSELDSTSSSDDGEK